MNLPKYVFIHFDKSTKCALRLIGPKYYRDGGNYYVNTKIFNNKLYSKSIMPSVNHKLLTECTEEEWRECNGQFTPEQ